METYPQSSCPKVLVFKEVPLKSVYISKNKAKRITAKRLPASVTCAYIHTQNSFGLGFLQPNMTFETNKAHQLSGEQAYARLGEALQYDITQIVFNAFSYGEVNILQKQEFSH